MLFEITQPTKLIYMAVDGVAPRAKMNQQRSRRFRSAHDRNVEFQKMIKAGELPPDADQSKLVFDSNCITPGTKFMQELTEAIRYFIIKKVSEDRSWAKLEVILSGPEVPGEGEHKIMEYIRHMRASGKFDPNASHCMYGLDADLIMLALVTHEPNFCLLREKVEFSFRRKVRGRKYYGKIDTPNVVYAQFEFLSVGLLREYLAHEFLEDGNDPQNLQFDIERIVDDVVFFCFLVGNDFLPHIPTLDIREGALGVMIRLYKHLLPRFGGYLIDRGKIDWVRFEIFVSKLGLLESKVLALRRQTLKSKRVKVNLDDKGEAINHDELWGFTKHGGDPIDTVTSSSSEGDEDDVENLDDDASIDSQDLNPNLGGLFGADDAKSQKLEKMISKDHSTRLSTQNLLWDEERIANELEDANSASNSDDVSQLKATYYKEKFKFDPSSDAEELKKVKVAFMEGITWTLDYYYRGVSAWRWYYPYYYAPMASDLVGLAALEQSVNLVEASPFFPFEQLLSVLPLASAWCLPAQYQRLMTDPDSVLKPYFPEQIELDMNGKTAEWEAVVLLPFVLEDVLLRATSTIVLGALTKEEAARNTLAPASSFRRVSHDSPGAVLPRNPLPKYLPEIRVACCEETKLTSMMPEELARFRAKEVFGGRVPEGYIPPYQYEYFTDLPSLRFLPYSARHGFVGINIHGNPSKGESLVLQLGSIANYPKLRHHKSNKVEYRNLTTADAVFKAGFAPGERVLVSYPWVCEAQIIQISDAKEMIGMAPSPLSAVQAGATVTPAKDEKTAKAEIIREAFLGANPDFAVRAAELQSMLIEQHGIELSEPKVLLAIAPAVERDHESHLATLFDESKPLYVPIDLVRPMMPVPAASKEMSAIPDLLPNDPVICLSSGPMYACLARVLESKDRDKRDMKDELFVKVKFELARGVAQEPQFGKTVAQADMSSHGYMTLQNLAKECKVPVKVLSQMVGTLPVLLPNDEDGEPSELDIGLAIRFVSKNLVVPGYARVVSSENSRDLFLFSKKTLQVIQEYVTAFPSIISILENVPMQEKPTGPRLEWTAFSRDPTEAMQTLNAIRQWMKLLEIPSLPLVSGTSKVLSRAAILKIEKMASECRKWQEKEQIKLLESKTTKANQDLKSFEMTVGTKRLLLGNEKDFDHGGSVAFELGDRVINIRGTGVVPFGLRGTVVGIQEGRDVIEIVFDEGFPAGTSLHGRCTDGRGIGLPAKSLLRVIPGSKNLESLIGTVNVESDNQAASRKTYVEMLNKKAAPGRSSNKPVTAAEGARRSFTTAARANRGPQASAQKPKTAPSEGTPFHDPRTFPVPSFANQGHIQVMPPGMAGTILSESQVTAAMQNQSFTGPMSPPNVDPAILGMHPGPPPFYGMAPGMPPPPGFPVPGIPMVHAFAAMDLENHSLGNASGEAGRGVENRPMHVPHPVMNMHGPPLMVPPFAPMPGHAPISAVPHSQVAAFSAQDLEKQSLGNLDAHDSGNSASSAPAASEGFAGSGSNDRGHRHVDGGGALLMQMLSSPSRSPTEPATRVGKGPANNVAAKGSVPVSEESGKMVFDFFASLKNAASGTEAASATGETPTTEKAKDDASKPLGMDGGARGAADEADMWESIQGGAAPGATNAAASVARSGDASKQASSSKQRKPKPAGKEKSDKESNNKKEKQSKDGN